MYKHIDENLNSIQESVEKTAIKIMYNIVIGNAFLSTGRNIMTKEEIYNYWHIVDELLPELYYTYGSNNSFIDFYEDYDFLFKRVNNSLELITEKNTLERYFRLGIPKQVIKALDEAGIKYNDNMNEKKGPVRKLTKNDK